MKYYPILKHTTRYKKSMCKVKINVNRDIRVLQVYILLTSLIYNLHSILFQYTLYSFKY